jgi:hypothetical protein
MNIENANYMGALVVKQVITDQLIECVGAQIPSNVLIEIAVHEASYDMRTKQVVLGDSVTKIQMTDRQFGEAIARPNFNEGMIVTLTESVGFNIGPVSEANIPYRERLAKQVDSSFSDNEQAESILTELSDITISAMSKGRLTKTQNQSLRHNLSVLQMNILSNHNFGLELVNETALQRLEEAKNILSRQFDGNRKPTPTNLLECAFKETGQDILQASAFFYLSTGRSSGQTLFDDISLSGRSVGITISEAVPKGNTELALAIEHSYHCKRTLVDVEVSQALYASFLRGNGEILPCTIRRRLGKRMDDVLTKHTQMLSHKELTINDSPELKLLDTFIDQVSIRLANNEYRGKSGLVKLKGDIERLKNKLDGCDNSLADNANSVLQFIGNEQTTRLQNHIQNEMAQLPQEDAIKLSHMLNRVSHILIGKTKKDR